MQLYRRQPILVSSSLHTKDPCVVFDGDYFHIFGSAAKTDDQVWTICHFTAKSIDGPWRQLEAVQLYGVCGPQVCAPGVLYEDGVFHMFVQTACFDLGGRIEYLTSTDGTHFTHRNTALQSEGTEAGIYDPHPAIINGQRYITYSGMPSVSRGDIYLARSSTNTWEGPWERLGKILSHEQVPHHNQHDALDYEWGLEGSQLLQLPDGKILLNAVCFLPEGVRGSRQRVFFAIADDILGPYRTLGPLLKIPEDGWDSGENGHASCIFHEGKLHLFYQARSPTHPWSYGKQEFSIGEFF